MSYGFTKEKLLELHYSKNLSVTEIASLYGCHRDSVRVAMTRFGIVPRGKIRKPLNDDLKAALVTLYIEQKLSVRQVAKIIGKSHSFVSDKLREIGIDVDDRMDSLQSERNPCWKSGKTESCGYVQISSRKVSQKKKTEHQIVMETYIGRELKENEVVHHIDRNKKNNNINNLALMDRSAHARLHALERWKNNA